MKKVEAEQIAPEVSRVIMEYITNILTDSVSVDGTIQFQSEKVEGYPEKMCEILISVPQKDFFRPINSKIPSVHSILFYTQILRDLTEHVLYSDTMSVGRFYSVKPFVGPYFNGLDATGPTGNRLKINFANIGTELSDAIDEYNEKFEAYKAEQEEKDASEKAKAK